MKYLIVLLILCSSCTSAWHLERAIKKDPSILKQDTLVIPEIKIDTFYKLDSFQIQGDIDSIFTSYIINNDTCLELVKSITPEIVKYVREDIIKDTLTYQEVLKTDSLEVTLLLKAWLESGNLHLKSEIINSRVYSSQIIHKDKSLLKKWQEFVLFGICLLLVLLLLKK